MSVANALNMFPSLRKRPLTEGTDDATIDLDLARAATSSSSRIDLDENVSVSANVIDLDEDELAPAGNPAITASVPVASLAECNVDGVCVHAGDRAAGKYYLFTVVTQHCLAQYQRPDDIGREGLFTALKSVYAEAYPDTEHTLHNGPIYGIVARELHANSNVESSRNPHLHCAAAFSSEHRWKTIERLLRQRHDIKVIDRRHHNRYRKVNAFIRNATLL